MDQKAIVKYCKDLGCCDACCLRYLGLKNPAAYENPTEFIEKNILCGEGAGAGAAGEEAEGAGAAKRAKTEHVCVSCLGVLQPAGWPAVCRMLAAELERKGYESATFACALSAPVAALVREHAVWLAVSERAAGAAPAPVPLKEAWRWAAGAALARAAGRGLESGAAAPLLATVHLEYEHEAPELEWVAARAPPGRAGAALGVTRRAAERALAAANAASLRAVGALPPAPPLSRARPVAVACAHEPLYLAGRYVKLSRTLPQTPWVVRGARLAPDSVQELVCRPLAELLGMEPAAAEHRLKFIAAGREDVDVRCLGTGRPFAVEVADPRRAPAAAELAALCARISAGGLVRVAALVPVTRERLADLKHGEETKSKTYEALCVKLSGAVSERELAALRGRSWALRQRTPLRVLHRRALAARARALAVTHAAAVRARPELFLLRLRTAAGTYVKEWAHGDLRRTRPALAHALRAPADILALDVTHVHLDWP